MEGSHGLRFFRVLLPGFSTKLMIPRAIAEHVSKETSRGKVTLVSPKGNAWHADLYKEAMQGQYFIGGAGWKAFVRAHHLELGFFLVFHYRGNMVFGFRIFDLSTCEKTDTYIAAATTRKKRKIMKDCGINEKESVKAKVRHSKGLNLKKPTKDAPKKSAECSQERRTSRRKSNHNKGASFKAILVGSNINRQYMNIPSEFIKFSGLSTADHEVKIRDPEGRMWTLNLAHRRRSGRRIMTTSFGKGWLDFARENRLKVGDRCDFELVSHGKAKGIHMRLIKQ